MKYDDVGETIHDRENARRDQFETPTSEILKKYRSDPAPLYASRRVALFRELYPISDEAAANMLLTILFAEDAAEQRTIRKIRENIESLFRND